MLIGLVGKPSSGKSTFFKASTLAEAEIASYPFTTIKPNHGIAFVRVECVEKEFNVKCNPRLGYCINGTRFVPVEMLDVAGLVPGAHEGKGMGNQFLDDLRQADAFIHIVDASGSTNEKGEIISAGSYDPALDIIFLEKELDMWYYSILKKGWERLSRRIQQEGLDVTKALAKQLSGLNVTEEIVKEAVKKLKLNLERPDSWTEKELMALANNLRGITKPMAIAANKIDITGSEKNLARLREQFPSIKIIPCSADCELALKEAASRWLISYLPGDASFNFLKTPAEKQKQALDFIQKNVLDKFGSTGVQETIDYAVFELLKYIAIFPGGVSKLEDSEGRRLPDCFLLKQGSTALDFAFKLHTDFGKNFIRAIDVKTKKTVGKEHILKHRDVIEIISRK